MKIFAYYLPQFHRIPENDKWWGKGFTEWVNVKKAKPLFTGHDQPKVPLNNNYYSLDNIETLKWQSRLMEDYKVDGLIFYHYYFTGKKLLEKPAEMLLKHKDIKINFFFCWANHSWRKSWEGSTEMLVEQTYGTEKDWKKHFDYLLPFFKDKRYEKRGNKPLLMVFVPDFKEKEPMFEYFNKRCTENGFDGICIIESVGSSKQLAARNVEHKYTNIIHYREPLVSIVYLKHRLTNLPARVVNAVKKRAQKISIRTVLMYSGDKLYKEMCNTYRKNDGIIRGVFFEWDNTPRHGYRGYIITPVSEYMFKKYMDLVKDDEYLFVNAWNEWAEGMMLEPTEANKYKYLEWIKDAKK